MRLTQPSRLRRSGNPLAARAETSATIAKKARDGRSELLLLGTYLPIGGAALGIVAMVVGFLLASSGTRGGVRRDSHADEPPPGAHRADSDDTTASLST